MALVKVVGSLSPSLTSSLSSLSVSHGRAPMSRFLGRKNVKFDSFLFSSQTRSIHRVCNLPRPKSEPGGNLSLKQRTSPTDSLVSRGEGPVATCCLKSLCELGCSPWCFCWCHRGLMRIDDQDEGGLFTGVEDTEPHRFSFGWVRDELYVSKTQRLPHTTAHQTG